MRKHNINTMKHYINLRICYNQPSLKLKSEEGMVPCLPDLSPPQLFEIAAFSPCCFQVISYKIYWSCYKFT